METLKEHVSLDNALIVLYAFKRRGFSHLKWKREKFTQNKHEEESWVQKHRFDLISGSVQVKSICIIIKKIDIFSLVYIAFCIH